MRNQNYWLVSKVEYDLRSLSSAIKLAKKYATDEEGLLRFTRNKSHTYFNRSMVLLSISDSRFFISNGRVIKNISCICSYSLL